MKRILLDATVETQGNGTATPALPVPAAPAIKSMGPLLPVVQKQVELFGGIFRTPDAELQKGVQLIEGERGLSIKMVKRSGKGDSLALRTGLTGDALSRWEREQSDKLLQKQVAALNTAVASGMFTGGSFRITRNGSLGINAKFVGVKAVTLDTASKAEVIEAAKKLGLKVQ